MTEAALAPPAEQRPPPTHPSPRMAAWRRGSPATATAVVVIGVVVVGMALRIWAIAGPLGRSDSDEAVVGLMARHLLHGEFRTFYWQQPYGGSLETFFAAAVFFLFGTSRLTMRLVPVLETGLAAVILWRIALRLLPARQALVAAATLWLWPLVFVWFGTRQMLFYVPTLVLGLLTILFTLRAAERPRRLADWAALGLVVGLGWWTSPNILYFVAPCALWLVVNRCWDALRRLPLALPFAALGALPWLLHNVGHGFPSLGPDPIGVSGSYLDHLNFYFLVGLPTALGLRMPYTGALVAPKWPSVMLFAIAFSLLAAGAWLSLRRRAVDGLGFLLFGFLYALSPLTSALVQGRYFYFLIAFVPLLLARLATTRVRMAGLALVVAVSTVVSMRLMTDLEPRSRPEVGSLISRLEAGGYRHVFADYWDAYRIDLESQERIVATSFGYVRYLPYDREVRQSALPVYVFLRGAPGEARFNTGLTIKGLQADFFQAGAYNVYVPLTKVLPEELSEARLGV